MFEFLTDPDIQSPRLTRVDIAFDDYEGNFFTPEQARAECNKKKHGIFFTQGRPPSWEMIGDWDSPTGKKTLYVGSASSEKRLRVYTKGRALGDPDSPWIRSEWVLRHSSQFVLPFDLLTRSSQYLAAAYRTPNKSGPFQFLSNSDDELASSRLKLASHTVPISLDKQIRHARRAAGKLIYTLKQLGYSDSQIIEQLESQGTPPKLIPALELFQRFH